MNGIAAGNLITPDAGAIAAMEAAFDLEGKEYEIVWYTAKVQKGQGEVTGIDANGKTADVHVDGYVKNVSAIVKYNSNYPGSLAAADSYTDSVITGIAYTVLSDTNTNIDFKYPGYKFIGWSTSANGEVKYLPGDSINPIMSSVELFAKWEAEAVPTPTPTPDPTPTPTPDPTPTPTPDPTPTPTPDPTPTPTPDPTPTPTPDPTPTPTPDPTPTPTPDPTPTPTPDPTPSTSPEPSTNPGGGGGSGYDYYDITIYYVDENDNQIRETVELNHRREGTSYDVSEYDALDIDGYVYDSTDGKLSGRLNRDVVITVHYVTETDIPDETLPEGGNPEGGSTETPVDPGEVDITDKENPGSALPEGGYSEVSDPGKLPQTGTVAEPVNSTLTLGAIALLISLSMAGLLMYRRREEDRG
jgi:hypothetical protein